MNVGASLSLLVLAASAAQVAAQPYGQAPPLGQAQAPQPSMAYPGPAAPMPWGPGEPASVQPLPGAPALGSMQAPPQTAPEAQSPGDMGQVMQAAEVLKEGMDKLLGFLRQTEQPNNLQVAAFLNREIAPYFDFDYMAQWVAGPAYAGMTPEEKKALAARLEADFLATLARNLAGYDGQQVRMMPPRRGPRGAVSVNVAVLQAGSYPSRLEFRMAGSEHGWKVYDVLANGQSAAAYYRLQFQREARQQLGYLPR